MKTFNICLSVLVMLGLLVTVSVFAAEISNSGTFHTFNASDLIGNTVKNSHGDDLGKVEDVVIGSDGRAHFVVLSRGGTLSVGAKYIPVPYQTFMSNSTNIAKINTDNDLIANLDKAKLDTAPSFKDKKYDLSSRDSQMKICRHYGAGACPYM